MSDDRLETRCFKALAGKWTTEELARIPPDACQITGITTDQRGVKRPQGNGCDIGAYEYISSPSSLGSAEGVALYTSRLLADLEIRCGLADWRNEVGLC
jgi:hypothetical protein